MRLGEHTISGITARAILAARAGVAPVPADTPESPSLAAD